MSLTLQGYLRDFWLMLQSIDPAEVDRATALLRETYERRSTIYVIGNGQSATTATAFALDLTKQSLTSPTQQRFRIVSLADNTAALTAWANDVGYEVVFTEQLRGLWEPGDLLLAVSVSGNSPNVVHAARHVYEREGRVISMVGFEGGQLRGLSDACIIVRSSDYGYVETAHVAIMHYWVDLFRERLVL